MSKPIAIADAPVHDNPATIPPLKHGDRLTRAEFEQRYDAMPNLKKAELIEGVVHMPSPVRLENHGNPHCNVVTWLGVYKAYTPGVIAGDNTTIRLDLDNEPQPDALALIHPALGGRARISDDDYVEGGPEFVGEVSASTTSIDMTTKFRVYRRNQVQEYLIYPVMEPPIDWYSLDGADYTPLIPEASGWLRSKALPGLWLDPAALLRNDMATVLQVLQKGLDSPEHVEFVKKLAKSK